MVQYDLIVLIRQYYVVKFTFMGGRAIRGLTVQRREYTEKILLQQSVGVNRTLISRFLHFDARIQIRNSTLSQVIYIAVKLMLLYCIIIADLLGEVPFSHVCWSSTLENQIGRTFGARRQKLPLFTRLRSRQSNSNPRYKFSWIFHVLMCTVEFLASPVIQELG